MNLQEYYVSRIKLLEQRVKEMQDDANLGAAIRKAANACGREKRVNLSLALIAVLNEYDKTVDLEEFGV